MSEELFRLRIILLLIIIISLGILIRIIYISSLDINEYNILEENKYSIRRGDILDRRGTSLAISDELESVFANPKEVIVKDKAASILSDVLNESKAELIKKLNKKINFVWLKRFINPRQADYIRSLNIHGIFLKKEYKRFYPNKKIASHILGFCNIDSIGVEGIEKSMDSYLIGDQKNMGNNSSHIKGGSLILTIDSNIQAIADMIISKNVIEQNAKSGSLILIDGLTGEILCISNYPNFDPNFYSNYEQRSFRNFAIFNQYEPGSIVKIFSLSALLDLNLINKSDSFYCNGAYKNGNAIVKCTGVHGTINYDEIIKYSCNAGMLEASERLNGKDLYYYLKLFGFGMHTNIKLPGEQDGILRNIKDWNYRSMLSIPIGQEISVNAMQIIRASTTFVNDGVMIDPYIIKALIDTSNKLTITKRNEIRRVIRNDVSKKILYAMKTSTDPNGTVKTLQVEGIKFAAKSGTGQIYDNNIKSYSEYDFTSSLLVIFPYDSPRYIAYIIFDRPKEKIWGGIIGSKVLNEFLFNLTGYMKFENKESFAIPNNKIKINKKFKKIESLPDSMPDLKGLSAGDIIDIFSNFNLDIRIFGNGLVINQEPVTGEMLDKNTKIKIYLE